MALNSGYLGYIRGWLGGLGRVSFTKGPQKAQCKSLKSESLRIVGFNRCICAVCWPLLAASRGASSLIADLNSRKKEP